jgi:hypothetical protein
MTSVRRAEGLFVEPIIKELSDSDLGGINANAFILAVKN